MRTHKLAVLLFIIFSAFRLYCATDNFPNINDSYLFSQLFFPISEGSDNQKKFADYLKQFADKNNLAYRETKVSGASYETNAVNIELTLNATTDENSTILIAAPLNSVYTNGRFYDFSLSQCLALQVLQAACENPPQKNLKVVFLGANATPQETSYGMQQFLKENSGLFINTFAIVLDIDNSFVPVTLSACKNGKNVPKLVLDKILNCIKENNNCVKFSVTEIIRSRLKIMNNSNSILDAFLSENINAVLLTNTNNYKNTSGNYYSVGFQNQLFGFIKDYYDEIDNIPANFKKDYNYLVQSVKLGKQTYVLQIPEHRLLLIYFIILFCSVLLFKIVAPFRNPIKLMQFYSSIPFFILSFLVLYVVSFVPFLFESLISFIHHFPFSYGRSMFFYFFSIFIVLMLFSFFILDIAPKIRLPIQWKNNLYLQMAIYCTYINLFVIVAVDISFSYVYFLFLFFIALSMMIKKIRFKFLCYALSFIGFFFALFYITQSSGGRILIDLTKSVFLLHFVFCLFSFPFIIISVHMYRIMKMSLGISDKHEMGKFIILMFMCIFPQIISIHYSNRNEAKDIDVSIIHDYNQKADFISMQPDISTKYRVPRKLELSDLHTGKQYAYNFDKDKILEIHPVLPKEYSLDVSSHGGLHSINIGSDKNINKIEAILVCPETVEPIHTNFRCSPIKEIQNSTYDLFRLLIPGNCGNNIELQLELLPGHEYTLNIEITFNDSQPRFLFFPVDNFYCINEKNKESIKLK